MVDERNVETMLLRAKDAALALSISERTLWSLTQSRDIPSVRIGRAVRYDPRDLLAWIEYKKKSAVPNKE
jgi:excisionase family DNA binding protein